MLGLWSKLEDGEFPFSLTKDLGVNLVFTQRANGLQTGTHVQRWIKKKCNLLPNLFFLLFARHRMQFLATVRSTTLIPQPFRNHIDVL